MTKKSHRPNKVQKLFIALALFILGLNSFSQNEFVTTWKTDNPGTSNSTSITIPTTGGGYNYDVDWNNDGAFDEFGITGNVTHDFTSAGNYTIRIQGAFPRIYFNCGGDKEKIISIDQWGTNSWTSMQGAFYCCLNLVSNATDTPNLTGVTDMSDMFWNAGAFNADLSSWDVSNVTDMSYAFGITAVTGNLSSWDVSNVTNMYAMFSGTTAFNGDISTWNVGKVTDMGAMFDSAEAFNGDLSSWDVSNVTNMYSMFYYALVFNGDISTWNISSVTDISSIFQGAAAFNGDLSSWDISGLDDLSGLFSGCTSFNRDLSTWDVSGVTNMSNMFYGATAFNGDISNWNVSNVGSMSAMFSGAAAFNGDISSWNVGNVGSMSYMFEGATTFNGDINGWDVSNVVDMDYMFSGATAFDRNIGNWDISNILFMTDMFIGATLSTTNYDNTLIGWNTLTGSETQIPTFIFNFNGGNSTFCNGEAARTSLINDYTWGGFSDGGLDCSGLGLDDYSLTSLRLYPNPTRYEFRIEGVLEKSVLEIYNLTGQLVKSEINYKGALVDISELSSEVYFVKISNPNGTGIKRLLKE